ncbi:MAG: hypothetical protein M3270_11075 [Thermoproteota archaeon]|nr:hypothetical protein [Thermoproteota archaeon]
MSKNSERKFYKGSARWIIVGIIAALAITFIVAMTLGSTIFPGGPKAGIQSETADQSATSGPGHNTTNAGGAAIQGQQGVATNTTGTGTEQIPDSEVTFGRETSTLQTPMAGQQGGNNSTNSTNDGLANPLSENLTSLTGTSS